LHSYVPVNDGWVRVDAPAGTEHALVKNAWLSELDREAAVAWLAQCGIPATSARPFGEVRFDERLLACELVHTFKRSDGSIYTTPGRFVRFGRTPNDAQLIFPGLGEHTSRVLTEIGISCNRQNELLKEGVIAVGEMTDPVIFNYR
jgi:crotonobetainyl-CoA:carnitine CoA-transferase CaiB-like acyl-CoA transferase